MKHILALFMLIIVIASCNNKPNELTSNDIEAIKSLDKSYVELIIKHNWDSLAKLLTPDVVLFPPNESEVMGQSSNLMRFKNFGNIPIEYSHITKEIGGTNKIAYVQGAYHIKLEIPNNEKPYEDSGKYLWVVKKQLDQKWKIHRVTWNSSHPLNTQ
jgi:ketosteroid isomerase-like protein